MTLLATIFRGILLMAASFTLLASATSIQCFTESGCGGQMTEYGDGNTGDCLPNCNSWKAVTNAVGSPGYFESDGGCLVRTIMHYGTPDEGCIDQAIITFDPDDGHGNDPDNL